jgi:hypothetical protein
MPLVDNFPELSLMCVSITEPVNWLVHIGTLYLDRMDLNCIQSLICDDAFCTKRIEISASESIPQWIFDRDNIHEICIDAEDGMN